MKVQIQKVPIQKVNREQNINFKYTIKKNKGNTINDTVAAHWVKYIAVVQD